MREGSHRTRFAAIERTGKFAFGLRITLNLLLNMGFEIAPS